jgi:hypothetical protein
MYVIYHLFWGVSKHTLFHYVNIDLKEVLVYVYWINASQDIAQFQGHGKNVGKRRIQKMYIII